MNVMHGLMQDRPLTLPLLLRGMERQYADSRVTTSYADGPQTATFREVLGRVHALGYALDRLGVPIGARVGTFGWNTQRHLELYLAVPSSGRVLHTINHRLFGEQIDYIIRDAQNDVIFVDRSIAPIVWPQLERAEHVRHIIVTYDGSDAEIPDDPRVHDYDALLAQEPHHGYDFKVDDERQASGLCYTSGTTGQPKGVLYDHRSTVIHALFVQLANGYAVHREDVVMPVVPMFHVNAWGLPYAAIMCGADLSLPGPAMRPEQLAEQIERDKVSFSAAVTTVWATVFPFIKDRDTSSLRSMICGGGVVPLSLSEQYREHVGIHLSSGWGMTETSPVATYIASTSPRAALDDPSEELGRLSRPGPMMPLTAARIIEPDGTQEMPWDDESVGELEVCGLTVAGSYFNDRSGSAFTDDGWLRTGDLAAIGPDGSIRVVDRVKDLIKSGGEWISSVELENEIVAHPDVVEVAVIARPDERWSERPLACIVVRDGAQLDEQQVRDYLAGKVASWWIPEDIKIVDSLPKTATGKLSKLMLRQEMIKNN